MDERQLSALSFEPLTPLSFLDRAAHVFADRTAVVDGARRTSYAELRERVFRLAGALRELKVAPGDRVALLAPNSAFALECHYAIPRAGAILVPLNYRLQPHELAQVIEHSGARLLLCDGELADIGRQSIAKLAFPPRLMLDEGPSGTLESLIAAAEPVWRVIEDERAVISLNYTSGTTGAPKGVMYHHRGAYLQSLAMALHARLDARSVFLWTLPMFHCNGWCFTWAVTAVGGTHVCLRKVESDLIWELIDEERVTHLNAAPTVLTMMVSAASKTSAATRGRIHVCTGGAPPSPTLIAGLGDLAIDVTHLYGLTETFGPIMICEPQPSWEGVSSDELATLMSRQGVGNIVAVRPRVVDHAGEDVPADGRTLGEIALRGNNVMLGYFRAPELTREAAPDGWFRTGDLAVLHPDGYLEIRDRAKDIIISGGENISSVEVEQALVSHPGVLEAAVVSAPDERWGEVPVAYVTLHAGASIEPPELIDYVKSKLARYKAPKRVIVGPLPKTATGKIMKYRLRDELWRAHREKPVS